jgi:hypothetical protein
VASASLANFDLKKPFESGVGIIEGSATLTAFSGEVECSGVKIEVKVVGSITVTLTAATLEDIAKAIGKNPYAAMAVALVVCTVGLVYTLAEKPSYDDLLDLRNAARNLASKAANAYLAGLKDGNGDGDAGAAGAKAHQKFFDDMRAKNPSATDDDISAELNNQIPGVDTLTTQFLPQAQDATWTAWAGQYGTGLKQTVVSTNQARLAWESIFPGVDYAGDKRFTKYFSLSDQEKLGAEGKEANDEKKQKLWKEWVGKNKPGWGGMTGANRSEAQASFASIYPGGDWSRDADYKQYWG